jgi:hypothetical protein
LARRPELLALLEESGLSSEEREALTKVLLSGAREKEEAKEQ